MPSAHVYRSTIKTLPATLPEPRPEVRGASFADHRPAAPDQAPGLLMLFAGSGCLWIGGGRVVGQSCLRLGPWTLVACWKLGVSVTFRCSDGNPVGNVYCHCPLYEPNHDLKKSSNVSRSILLVIKTSRVCWFPSGHSSNQTGS